MVNAFQTSNENISLVRGDTLAFGILLFEINEVNDDDGIPLQQDLDECSFTVRKDFFNENIAIQKTIGNGIEKAAQGEYRVRIAPEDTANMDVGIYYYDCDINLNSDTFTILKGSFEILPNMA